MKRLLVLTLLVAACSGAAVPTEVALAPVVTPQVVYVTPAPTVVAPTAAPTAKPTAEPTIETTPEPTIDDTLEGLLAGLEFIEQNLDFMTEFSTVWEQAADEIGNWPAFRDSVDELESLVDGHQVWLATHVPHPCYQVAHAHWITAMNLYEEGIADMQYGLIAPVTTEDIMDGIEKVSEGQDWVNVATEAMDCD